MERQGYSIQTGEPYSTDQSMKAVVCIEESLLLTYCVWSIRGFSSDCIDLLKRQPLLSGSHKQLGCSEFKSQRKQ